MLMVAYVRGVGVTRMLTKAFFSGAVLTFDRINGCKLPP